ncbi:MAG: hypothetical protein PHS17_01270 [Desulfobacterales bacterium]|nr:hypothetical protein [Desulfobacterales bacterium]
MKSLHFGSDVEVIEPVELAKEMREEIGRMNKVYCLGKEGVSRKSLS